MISKRQFRLFPKSSDQQHLFDLLPKRAKECDDLFGANSSRKETEIKLLEGQTGDSRELLPSKAVLKNRRLVTPAPGEGNTETLAQAGFIDEYNAAPSGWAFFERRPAMPFPSNNFWLVARDRELCRNLREFGLQQSLWDGKILGEHIKQHYGVTLGGRQYQRILGQLGLCLRKPRHQVVQFDSVKGAAVKNCAVWQGARTLNYGV